jgi:hypothetical protein
LLQKAAAKSAKIASSKSFIRTLPAILFTLSDELENKLKHEDDLA